MSWSILLASSEEVSNERTLSPSHKKTNASPDKTLSWTYLASFNLLRREDRAKLLIESRSHSIGNEPEEGSEGVKLNDQKPRVDLSYSVFRYIYREEMITGVKMEQRDDNQEKLVRLPILPGAHLSDSADGSSGKANKRARAIDPAMALCRQCYE